MRPRRGAARCRARLKALARAQQPGGSVPLGCSGEKTKDRQAKLHKVAALDFSWFGGASSTLSDLTTPSSTIME